MQAWFDLSTCDHLVWELFCTALRMVSPLTGITQLQSQCLSSLSIILLLSNASGASSGRGCSKHATGAVEDSRDYNDF